MNGCWIYFGFDCQNMEWALVTGASGFIGKHLVLRLLKDGYAVRALVRDRTRVNWTGDTEVVEGDVQDLQAMKMATAGMMTVFHLAGRAHDLTELREDASLYGAVNVQGTKNVLEGAVAGGVKQFVFISSVKAMGEETGECVDETSKPAPVTEYGKSKLAAENLVFEYGKKNGIHVSCLRPPLVYGPGGKGNLYRMISAVERGIFPPLPTTGNRRSMVHVANLVEAAILAATHPASCGQCYIVTDEKPYSTRDLYDMICRGLERKIPRWHVPLIMLKALGRAGDMIGVITGKRFIFNSDALEKLIGSAWYSSEKISRELGYRPSVNFEGALPELIAWFRKGRR